MTEVAEKRQHADLGFALGDLPDHDPDVVQRMKDLAQLHVLE